jgi:hypothetical protein
MSDEPQRKRAVVSLQLRTCNLCGNVASTLRAAVQHNTRCRVEQRPSGVNVPDDDEDIPPQRGEDEPRDQGEAVPRRPQRPLPIPFSAGRLPEGFDRQEQQPANGQGGEVPNLEEIFRSRQHSIDASEHRDHQLGEAQGVFEMFGSNW